MLGEILLMSSFPLYFALFMKGNPLLIVPIAHKQLSKRLFDDFQSRYTEVFHDFQSRYSEIIKHFPMAILAVGFFILLKHGSFHSSTHSYTDNILNK